MSYTLGFLGAGKMVTAIAKGIISSGIYNTEQIIASCTSISSGQKFEKSTKCQFSLANLEVIQNSKILVIGVKPQMITKVIEQLGDYFFDNEMIISIAAGVNLTTLKKYFGENVVRVMPNTPMMIEKGATAFCCSDSITQNQKLQIHKIFGSVGIIKEVDENDFDLITALSGSGPAFVFKYMEEMVASAVALGLNKELAFDLVAQTLSGSAEMIQQKIDTPKALREAVTSPNGTTSAGLIKMSELGFDNLIRETLIASMNRSIKLGKEI